MTEQQYPFKDDTTIVLGPGVFVAEDGSVLSWDGVNYVPQPSVPTREQIADMLARAWQEGRESIALDMTKPLPYNGIREATPNPYQNGADRG